jgi:dTMP kinase
MPPRIPECYIACALGGSLSKTAEFIESIAIEAGWKGYLPHRDTATPSDEAAPSDVLLKNLAAVFRSDCVVVETAPSLGVGIELAWARMAGKKVILLNREGRYLSRMVTGLHPDAGIVTYRTLEDAREPLVAALRSLGEHLAAAARPGFLVVLEGRDAVGKTETAARLVEALRAVGTPAEGAKDPPTIEPWGQLKEQFERGKDVDRLAEAITLLAARVDNTRRLILPMLAKGSTVILDRYFPSWLAYQDIQLEDVLRGQEERRQWLIFMHGLASLNDSIVQPDLTVWLEVNDEERRRRRGARYDPLSKYDSEEVQSAVLKGYETYSAFNRSEVVRIDTSEQKPEAVSARLASLISDRLKSGVARPP